MTNGVIVRLDRDIAVVSAMDADTVHELRISIAESDADISLRALDQLLRKFGIAASVASAELFVLAIAVFAADTRFPREAGDDGWTRRIALSVPARDPELWTEATPILERALRFLTGDFWAIDFREHAEPLFKPRESIQHTIPKEPNVALFSGGLDSFIGALDLVQTKKPLVLVGHYTDGSASVPQDDAFRYLQTKSSVGQAVEFFQARIVPPNDVFGEGNDDRQRARSFLFIAMGVMLAEALGVSELIVPENGLISLNVPLTGLRIGSYSTRTTHPHYFSLLSDAMSAAGIDIALRNPYQFKTKGEMLAECVIQDGLLEAASNTMSCAHPTASRWHHKGAPAVVHCGRCTACLIRRAAFVKAFARDETSYFLEDLRSGELRSDQAVGQDVRAVRMAAQRVQEDPGLAEFLVLKPGPLHGRYDEYADLYRRGMKELWTLVEVVKTRGMY